MVNKRYSNHLIYREFTPSIVIWNIPSYILVEHFTNDEKVHLHYMGATVISILNIILLHSLSAGRSTIVFDRIGSGQH